MEEDAEKINNESIKVEEDAFCASIEVSFVILHSQYITIKKECAGTYICQGQFVSFDSGERMGRREGMAEYFGSEGLNSVIKETNSIRWSIDC